MEQVLTVPKIQIPGLPVQDKAYLLKLPNFELEQKVIFFLPAERRS